MDQPGEVAFTKVPKKYVLGVFVCLILSGMGVACFGYCLYTVAAFSGFALVVNLVPCLLATGFYFVCAALVLRFLIDVRPGLLITSEGFLFWQYHFRVVSVSWNDVERVELRPPGLHFLRSGWLFPEMGNFVQVHLREDSKVPFRPGPFLRKQRGCEFMINNQFLLMSSEDISTLMNRYFEASTYKTIETASK